MYKKNFDRRVQHTPVLELNDTVRLNKTPTAKHKKEGKTLAEDPSLRLRPKKSGSYCMVRSAPYTATVDVDGLHIVVAVDRGMLAKAANEVRQDTEEVSVETSQPRNQQRATTEKATLQKQ